MSADGKITALTSFVARNTYNRVAADPTGNVYLYVDWPSPKSAPVGLLQQFSPSGKVTVISPRDGLARSDLLVTAMAADLHGDLYINSQDGRLRVLYTTP